MMPWALPLYCRRTKSIWCEEGLVHNRVVKYQKTIRRRHDLALHILPDQVRPDGIAGLLPGRHVVAEPLGMLRVVRERVADRLERQR
jgi:hypothetical protein